MAYFSDINRLSGQNGAPGIPFDDNLDRFFAGEILLDELIGNLQESWNAAKTGGCE